MGLITLILYKILTLTFDELEVIMLALLELRDLAI